MHNICWRTAVKGYPILVTGDCNGHPWLFKASEDTWSVEIADDQVLTGKNLPLVGYGCSGWFIELPHSHSADSWSKDTILTMVDAVLDDFKAGLLPYIPVVENNC